MTNIVLGSGPASVFCALSLLERGAEVLMIDPGEILEPEREKILSGAEGRPKAEWPQEIDSLVRQNTAPNVKGVPKKLVYGSDFPFRWLEDDTLLEQRGVDTLTSHAAGGLSNAWGANIFPLLPSDTDSWPLPIEALVPYYQRAAKHIPVAGAADGLSGLFPLYGDAHALPQSSQAASLIRDAEKNPAALKGHGMYIGRSRLAVTASACSACGLCLYGCPHKLIFSSAHLLPALRTHPRFTYRPGWIAKSISESGTAASVRLRNAAASGEDTATGERVFVGCGAVNSTALMLRSLEAYDEPVFLKDSQYFLTPFLRYESAGDVFSEELHTLSQVALEILDSALCSRSVHILFYTYNDMYYRALESLLGPLARLARPLLRAFLGRLIIMQGYLHSDFSGAVEVRLRKRKGGETVMLSASLNEKTKPLVKAIHSRMMSLRKTFRGIPISLMSHIGEPGKSYHLGGSFPMSKSPARFETDLYGRPGGFSRVHMIDAAVFPNVPATNITFTAMANAYRIAAESGGLL